VPLFMFLGLLLAVSLFIVWSRLQVVNLDYDLASLGGQMRELQQESQQLRLEAASLSRPARIEQLARKELGLRFPAPQQIITVD
jgi:cell division protein FtsL